MPTHKKINKNFFKQWSGDMAYVLGFLFADGNIVKTKRNTHYISFYSMDEKLLRKIKIVMGLGHRISKRNERSGFVYRIQIGNREMYDDLNKLGLHSNKVRRMRVPNVPPTFKKDFIRGFFDGDGNVWFGHINKHRKKPTKVVQVAFTSASKEFLKDLLELLRKSDLGIVGGSIYLVKGKNCSRLSFGTSDSLKIYEIMYNSSSKLFLKRKRVVFERYIKLRL